MSDRPPGRPRKRNYGIRLSAYVDKDIYDYLQEYVGQGHISDFVEETLRFAIRGNREIFELQKKLRAVETELKISQKEKEILRKENENLRKKVRKLELELEKLREKNDSSRILEKFKGQADEVHQLAEEIKRHIREGRSWGETLEELGVTDISARMDILHKLYSPRQVPYRGGFLEKNDILVSEQIKDYVLEKRGVNGYDRYVFKKR